MTNFLDFELTDGLGLARASLQEAKAHYRDSNTPALASVKIQRERAKLEDLT